MRYCIFLLCIVSYGCKNNRSAQVIETNLDTVQFYQVSDFVKGQINDISSTPYFMYKKISEGPKTDSSVISSAEFAVLASAFLSPDINNTNLKNKYEETVFFDQTTKTYTLNYSTRDKELEIQNIDVILKEDATSLKRIFIRKFFSYENDSSAIEQLSWKPDEQFQITRMIQSPGKPETVRQSVVVWNVKQ